MNLPKPNKQEKQAINQLAHNWDNFNILISYIERCLNEVRIANDDLGKDEIQVGQGIARGVKSILQNLKDLVKQ